MAFIEGCSCRVWAIDGWINDLLSHVVNEEINRVGTGLLLGNYALGHNHNQKIEQFKQCRQSPTLAHPCVIYGEFEYDHDVTPTHMWLESGPYIYDTIPGAPLRRKTATPISRRSPPSVDGVYEAEQIGSCNWYLTASHIAVLDRAIWEDEPGRPGVSRFFP